MIPSRKKAWNLSHKSIQTATAAHDPMQSLLKEKDLLLPSFLRCSQRKNKDIQIDLEEHRERRDSWSIQVKHTRILCTLKLLKVWYLSLSKRSSIVIEDNRHFRRWFISCLIFFLGRDEHSQRAPPALHREVLHKHVRGVHCEAALFPDVSSPRSSLPALMFAFFMASFVSPLNTHKVGEFIFFRAFHFQGIPETVFSSCNGPITRMSLSITQPWVKQWVTHHRKGFCCLVFGGGELGFFVL